MSQQLDSIYIGSKSGHSASTEQISAWLQEQQEKNKPAWFDGSCFYKLSGKYEVINGKLEKLHNLSKDGIFRHFEPCEYMAYNQACLNEYRQREADEEEKRQRHEQEKEQRRKEFESQQKIVDQDVADINRWLESAKVCGKRSEYTIKYNDGKTPTVKGTIYGDNLAIRKYSPRGKGAMWKIDHLTTGGSIGYFHSAAGARQCAFGLLKIADWSQVKSTSDVDIRLVRSLLSHCKPTAQSDEDLHYLADFARDQLSI